MKILDLGIVNNLQFSIVEDCGYLRGQLLFNPGSQTVEFVGKLIKDILSNFKSTIQFALYHNWQEIIKSVDSNRQMFFGDAADFEITKNAEGIITIYGQPTANLDDMVENLNFASSLINDIIEKNAFKLVDKMVEGEKVV